MKRSERRETIFRLLFMRQFRAEEEMDGLISEYVEGVRGGLEKVPSDGRISESEEQSIKDAVSEIASHFPEIDEHLNRTARGWKTSRMSKVDLTILRLAVYEMRYDDQVPTGVAINEAVEIAKKYSGDESATFVNGVLGQIARDLESGDPEREQ